MIKETEQTVAAVDYLQGLSKHLTAGGTEIKDENLNR
jgi:hypothetical protein